MSLIVDIDPALSSFTQRTVLDGREYVLAVQWNERAGKFSLSLADQDGDPIASGLVLVADYVLNRLLTDERAPPGLLLCVDQTGRGVDPVLGELGTRHTLVYVTAEERAAFEATQSAAAGAVSFVIGG